MVKKLTLYIIAAAEVAELEKAGKLPEEEKPKQDSAINHPSLPAEHQQPMNWPPMQAYNHYNGEQPPPPPPTTSQQH